MRISRLCRIMTAVLLLGASALADEKDEKKEAPTLPKIAKTDPAALAALRNAVALNPVTMHPTPKHEPVALANKGAARAVIVVHGGNRQVNAAVDELRRALRDAVGAPFESVKDIPDGMNAIVIGDCDEAKALGLIGEIMPTEGFAIRTAAGRVFIVGNGDGTAWGIFEFLERAVGMRWYFPTDLGRDVPRNPDLTVAPLHISDAPQFRMRIIWPNSSNPANNTGTQLGPLHTFLRAGNSWPTSIIVHAPHRPGTAEFQKERPEVFQLRSDGTRDTNMLCYGHPKTLETYLEQIAIERKGDKPAWHVVQGKAITVSPHDAEVSCRCEHCRKLWNEDAGSGGTASRILATFTAHLGREVKKRWPDMTVIYLPYLNYTLAPEGIAFPDNVEVQICGMPGLAMSKEPSVRESEQKNIDAWMRISGRKVQNWHYSCWPEDRTKAVFQYPNVVARFYRENRDKTIGTFINGVTDHWPRQSLTLYVWMKALWNPDFDTNAATDEFCARLFGPAAATMRELLRMQIVGWEESRWADARLSGRGAYEVSYPRTDVLRMAALFAHAEKEAKDDPRALERIAYYKQPFGHFFEASENHATGFGLKTLAAQKVGELPVIDGKLDDAVWKRAEALPFVRATDRAQSEPTYATEIRALWDDRAIVFGIRMTEPTPTLLETSNGGRDASMIWWDDNVEFLLDVTGRNEGQYYHFIINAEGACWDAHNGDVSWNTDKLLIATHRGKDFWSIEVRMPYDAFADADVPGSGTNTSWVGNVSRHRIADSRKRDRIEGSQREYQRLNTTYAPFAVNMEDLGPIEFRE